MGSLVENRAIPGIGRVGAIEEERVRVDCFESVAVPVVSSQWLKAAECRPATLLPQTRVYWQNADTGRWRAGRVVGGDRAAYFVRLPNSEFDVKVPESGLRVRWDRPVADPLDVLIAGANESPYFRDARLPMLRSLIAQRAACGKTDALISSAVEIYAHQIRAAQAVLNDPVRRYLLADEVGLGKTIEAGLVIRQILLDRPQSRVAVITPDVLRLQWQAELREKFFVDDFPQAVIKISSHETPGRWSDYHEFDLVVVDEAHRLVRAQQPGTSPYRELAALAHSVQQLLLLSATPLTFRGQTHLGFLHLLDPSLYRWEDRTEFERRFEVRKQLANAVYSLDADFEQLLPSAVSEISSLLPDDPQFRSLATEASAFLTPEGDLRQESDRPALDRAVEALRAHIAETYRLHRRTIRHRRSQVLRDRDDSALLPFDVAGRMVPAQVVLDSPRYQVAQDALLRWQSHVANWLHDHEALAERPRYGLALAVLASRADGVSGDLGDCLRWRLRGDAEAAARAGLSDDERAILSGPAIVPEESEMLAETERSADSADPESLAERLLPILASFRRVIIFCGPGTHAGRLTDDLRRAGPGRAVAEHSMRRSPESCAASVAQWQGEGGILVADQSAEDGLNLQAADAVVHCRLPWSPNQLEQRLGRVDRYAGPLALKSPAREYVATSADGNYSFAGAWLTLLNEGFGIFGGSLSVLQEAIDEVLPRIWSAGVLDGPEGIVALVSEIQEKMALERKEIDGMDMLESIHESGLGLRDIAESIGDLEADWRSIENAVVRYAGDDEGGLRFFHHRRGARQQLTQFERGPVDPLISPRLLALSGRSVLPRMMEAGFNRTAVLRIPGSRIFRAGNPLIDLLAAAIAIDDRGQASAFWRRSRDLSDGAEVYFGLDYLVEADTAAVLEMLGDSASVRCAIRRQADHLFEPFMRRVWVAAGRDSAIDHAGLITWLNRPYQPAHGDLNLNPERIGHLLDLFGGGDSFARAARAAEGTGRRELARVSDLEARRAAAREQGLRAVAIQRAQAQARHAAGRMTADTESYLTDVQATQALIDGLIRPVVRLVSVTCLGRGHLMAVSNAG